MSTEVEFVIEMASNECCTKVKDALTKVDGIESVEIFSNSDTVLIKSCLPISVIKDEIESTGQRAVIKGYGGTKKDGLQAAVAIVDGECGYSSKKLVGVVRFIQLDEKRCIIDGTIDGLAPGLHGLHIHELGDITDGCNRVGEHFSLSNTPHGAPHDDEQYRHTGDLGNIEVDENARAQFRFADSVLKVWDIVGRTVVVTENIDDLGRGGNQQSRIDGNSGKKLGCGIIARSAGLFENSKRLCVCDGVTLWDERNKPLAGPSRQHHNNTNLSTGLNGGLQL